MEKSRFESWVGIKKVIRSTARGYAPPGGKKPVTPSDF